jgi:RHS repeat-associated protein
LSPNLDPVPSALDESVVTPLAKATEFLYSGHDPIQKRVPAGTIELRRAAVLRGRVLAQDGNPLGGVEITIHAHPEFGSTNSRDDGAFDLAVNGGSQLTLSYEKESYLPARRIVMVPWQEYVSLPEVALVRSDSPAGTVDLNGTDAASLTRARRVSDAHGERQATLLSVPGTGVHVQTSDGNKQQVSRVGVHITEYTVGENGSAAMPADLPPNSGYTYAVEIVPDLPGTESSLVVDEPFIHYVENFLNFPVGGVVPLGYYDRVRATWVASDSGRIIQVLSVANGLADIDIDGSGRAADLNELAKLGMTDAERRQLAGLYKPGQSLWRVLIPHFSTWDCNWPFAPPADASPPTQPPPQGSETDTDPCRIGEGEIEVQNQVVRETVDIGGTALALVYSSDRVPEHVAGRSLEIGISGSTIPSSLKRIEFDLQVGGNRHVESLPAKTNQSSTFTWDGTDAYGRLVQGGQFVKIGVGYVYDGVYQQATRFGGSGLGGPITGDPTRREVTLWQQWMRVVHRWDARGLGLGGWSLSIHHTYDPVGKRLYMGDGTTRDAEGSSYQVITTIAGNGTAGFVGDGGRAVQAELSSPYNLAVSPDGSIYVADAGNYRVRRISPDGIITTVAGNGGESVGPLGDGGPATDAPVMPLGITIAPDGSLYVTDADPIRIRRVDPNGIITTVAGGAQDRGDNGPATEAGFLNPVGVALGPDGRLYIADSNDCRIRCIGTDGIITTFAGDGSDGFGGDGGPAAKAQLSMPESVAVAPDGSVYIADTFNARIRRVGTDGTITTVAGSGEGGDAGDGGPATEAALDYPHMVAVATDGSVYIAAGDSSARIRRVTPDGVITTVAGGPNDELGDGGPAVKARLDYPRGVAVGPDGVYVAGTYAHRIFRIASALPGVSLGDVIIPDERGTDAYIFDGSRHLRTVDTLTGSLRWQFAYDSTGHLTSVTSGDGDVTIVERDTAGNPSAIVSPSGQRTVLTVDANGYLSAIADPAGAATQLSYTDGGLLTSVRNPVGDTSHFAYDDLGRLTRRENAVGASLDLVRKPTDNGFQVTRVATGLSEHRYLEEFLRTGERRKANFCCGGLQTLEDVGPDGARTITYPDGTVESATLGPDPRWGMASPITQTLNISTPAELSFALLNEVEIKLSHPEDPLGLASLVNRATINDRLYVREYAAASRTITETTPASRRAVVTLDLHGRPSQIEVVGLLPVRFDYDQHGRLVKALQGAESTARTTTATYDETGYLQTITDALGRTTSFERDAVGRVVRLTRTDGEAIGYSYDPNGNLTALIPPRRPAHEFTYTPLNLLSTYVAPSTGAGAGVSSTVYGYSEDGKLIRVTRANGESVDFVYDENERLVTVSDGRGKVTYSYDTASGRLIGISASNGITLSYTYDGFLPMSETWEGSISGAVERTYDANFWTTSLTINGANETTFDHDADGLLTRAGDLNITRDSRTGLLTGTALQAITDEWSYNEFGEPVGYRATQDGAELYALQFTLDALGRITTRRETISGTTVAYDYAYDNVGRLAGVSKQGAPLGRYTYDSNGNRLSVAAANADPVTARYDDQDRLMSFGETTYAYTSNGELLTRSNRGQTTEYHHDALGALVAVKLHDETQIEYVLDGARRRVLKLRNGVREQAFLYQDRLAPIAELDETNDIVSIFVYGSRTTVPDYIVKRGTTYRLIADHLGSPRLVIEVSSGKIVQEMDFDEFGRVIADSNPGFQPFGFAGGIYDNETKLTQFGLRQYDADAGRWITTDSAGFASDATNLYAYAAGDPVNFIDPTGRDWMTWVRAGIAAMKLYSSIMHPELQKPIPESQALKYEEERKKKAQKRERRRKPRGGGRPPPPAGICIDATVTSTPSTESETDPNGPEEDDEPERSLTPPIVPPYGVPQIEPWQAIVLGVLGLITMPIWAPIAD